MSLPQNHQGGLHVRHPVLVRRVERVAFPILAGWVFGNEFLEPPRKRKIYIVERASRELRDLDVWGRGFFFCGKYPGSSAAC